MTWTATYGDKEEFQGKTRIFVDYTNGSKKVRREYFTTDFKTLVEIIKSEVKELEAKDLMDASVKTGEAVDLTDKAKTQAEIEKKAFMDDLNRLIQMRKAIDLGIKTDKDQDFIDLLQRVCSEYKEEYLPLL